ncbi:acetyltransferase pyr8 [Aspergillus thermomutatus]|uniref:Acetyltransferase pyr8 n=1 Tax=Aspergillus thermomutatus TaxID=41047 RepID=A0A397HAH1_ASPTH|nr:Acetyltransferase pyr8 [Aspergillus thermomutatus]RHZ57400.1 Acetyltransferase pyr8 [Aspergillus thermomutatus]
MDLLALSSNPLWSNIAHALALYLAFTVPTAFFIITTQKSSSVRRAWAPCVLYILYRFSLCVPSLTTSQFLKGVAAGQATVAALQCLNLLLITNLDETELVRAGLYSPSAGLLARLLHAWALLLNFRGIGTVWEVKNIPEHAAYLQPNGKEQRLSWKRYVLRESAIIIWQYLLLDFIYMSTKDTSPEDLARLFGPGLEFKYFDATFEQWMGRVSVGIFSWLVPSRVCLNIISRIYFLILVVLGISSPESCRPGFGRVRDACTIRGFWGKFWHQSFRWPLTSVSNYIARDVLRLPRPSLLERYTNIFFTFLTSGVLHLACDAILGVPPSASGAMKFFCSFPLAIMIEDGVQEVWRQATGQSQGGNRVPLWQRLVGFLWVGIWMCVTSPWYLYPAARQQPDKNWMVPVSVVEEIGLGAVQKILLVYGVFLYWAIGGEI